MSEVTIAVETGRSPGSRASNRLRAAGKVPGVVYGHGTEPVSVSVDRRELRHALSGEAGLNALLTLVVDGRRRLSIVKDLQRDPVHRGVQHVDFLLIDRDEVLSVEVPVVLEGEATAVLKADGVVEHVLNSLTVSAKPGDIPTAITYDVSTLGPGDTVRVGDLTLPEGVTTDVDPDEPVVSATVAAMDVPEPEGEAVEGDIAGEGEGDAAAPEGTAAGGTGADQG
ncbi:MAG TPA: 50S ribosomal protein L25 [Acidimicrobiales bacterium]|jgi:large subunit ribosomal protein L25